MTAKVATPAHWAALFASAVLEAVWAISLDLSRGLTVLEPSLVFLVATTIGMFGLGYAMRGIPISIAYTIWTGLGAAFTVGASFVMGTEEPSLLKILFLAGIVGCVIGLKFARDPKDRTEPIPVVAATPKG